MILSFKSCRDGYESNQLLRTRLSSAAMTSLNDVECASQDLLSYIECESLSRSFHSISAIFTIRNFMIVPILQVL